MDYVIRPLTAADDPILWETLYQGLQTKGEATPSRDIVRRPEFAHYVEGWGRAGDTGFVAYDPKQNDEVLGAVWLRVPTGQNASEVETTTELAFAVKPDHRRHGIGAALLTQLVKANPQHSAILVHAPANNPAVRLYEKFGFKIVRQSAESVTMRREA